MIFNINVLCETGIASFLRDGDASEVVDTNRYGILHDTVDAELIKQIAQPYPLSDTMREGHVFAFRG